MTNRVAQRPGGEGNLIGERMGSALHERCRLFHDKVASAMITLLSKSQRGHVGMACVEERPKRGQVLAKGARPHQTPSFQRAREPMPKLTHRIPAAGFKSAGSIGMMALCHGSQLSMKTSTSEQQAPSWTSLDMHTQ